MPRPQNQPPPPLSLEDAISTTQRIKTRRQQAHDPDMPFFPPVIRDDGDITDVLGYVQSYRRMPHAVRQAELPDRFRLIEYLRQQETIRRARFDTHHNKRLLAALKEAQKLRVSSGRYRDIIGLTRSGVPMLRNRLAAAVRGEPELPATTPKQRAAEDLLNQWLTRRRREIVAVLTAFADNHEDLIDLLSTAVADPAARQEVIHRVDHWAETMPQQPSLQDASLVAHVAHLLRRPRDTPHTLEDALGQAAKLREEFLQVRPPQR